MSENNEIKEKMPRNAASWAKPVDHFEAGETPAGAINLNVSGKRATGPLQGFGQLWQKTYTIRLEGADVSPQDVIATWKADFGRFWPKGNYFYSQFKEITLGDVAVLNVGVPGGMKVATGIRVIYADDESFTYMTPEGHMFAGLITFSAFDDEGTTVVQIQALIRASDPLIETTMRLGLGHKGEDSFWRATLQNLAADQGVTATATQKVVCVDKKVQWSQAKNIWHNSGIRTTLYMPVYLTKRLFGRR
jgi:hypothetical protein